MIIGHNYYLVETFRYWLLSQFSHLKGVKTKVVSDRSPLYLEQKGTLYLFLLFSVDESQSLQKYISRLDDENYLLIYHDSLYEKFLHYSNNVSALSNCMKSLERPLLEGAPMQDTPSVSFTQREEDVMELFAQGMSVKEVAFTLNISPYTVASHQRNLYLKTKSHTLQQLILFALMHYKRDSP
jgi:DNA-binding CsgD family transcriptional regulator